ncbi:uncharacterized protein EKO05_0011545 [Ascochyta rabiei]|uniref:uncharacterized protein n=1 Tax=Didymella rabiei TaxID=5454 RepID=UPI0019006C52|nr:uncharacterized protein EKO05_0011545 [Ascochyta rabiei]UPX21359.1 hypothetical protein EKO05_0011545 [Ascochyta rabiei]
MREFPLLERGWIFQERLFARRLVHYTNREISWECYDSKACQCTSPKDLIPYSDSDATDIFVGTWFRETNHGLKTKDFKALYRGLVSQYTGLSLTDERDRLPALAGLSEQVARTTGDELVYGLWKDSLVEDLLWSVSALDTAQKRLLRLPCYPSWSWASVNTSVDFATGFSGVISWAEGSHVETFAQAALATQPDGAEDQNHYLELTGQILPARLRLQNTGQQGLDFGNKYRLRQQSEVYFSSDANVTNASVQCAGQMLNVKVVRLAGVKSGYCRLVDYSVVVQDYRAVGPHLDEKHTGIS